MRRHNQNDKMKTKNKLYLLAVTAAALSLNATTSVGQVFNYEDVIDNRGVAASPRAKEVFPWLTRAPSPRTEACCAETTPRNGLTEARKNRAFAASPRVREQFPELGRSPVRRPEFTIAPLVEKNAAVLSSPRAREEFPAFSRGSTTGTAKGGASKLMELGK